MSSVGDLDYYNFAALPFLLARLEKNCSRAKVSVAHCSSGRDNEEEFAQKSFQKYEHSKLSANMR